MQLFHTSPEEIARINGIGRFGEFLFFSADIYAMSAGSTVTYAIEVDEADLIPAGRLFYHDDAAKLDGLVDEFCDRFGVDADSAEEIISEREQLDSTDADELWDVQVYTARAAKLLGYRGVRVRDEQGTAYMIDMQGHESELVKI
ncbi:hypothetical protein HMPREF3289_00995 [Pseudomonas sp. HMSC75E02]|uniref:hypothetical protein n=1 Tax=Pseudomonas sp. HMSC75E02 TaxID=1608908 RepID=UPI0008A8A9C5|nr:hypothetical protein [Pseudomonas sp. HMSC75E02]OHS09273.1 hypothetical protein HMPREF3289_00995 [Pseudomonas sp. HMSC75E02]